MEQAILDHESEEIFLAHLLAAAYELPLTPEDAAVFGPRWRNTRSAWSSRAGCANGADATCPAARATPPRESLRSASPDSVAIVEAEGGEVIGNVEASRAHSAVHPGAVYLHMGAAYEVEDLDLAQRRARSSGASKAIGTPSPSGSPRPTSSRSANSARPAEWRSPSESSR